MNKQEAIEKIKSKKSLENCLSNYGLGYNEALDEAIYIINQIDELESQAVPQLKEKLYTVEIPDQTPPEHYVLRRYAAGQVCIWCFKSDNWRGYECFQLTEAEIKKDFEWAWKWAKPVEGE